VRSVLVSPAVMGSREQMSRDGREKTPPEWRPSGMAKTPGDSSEPLLITASFTDEHTTLIDLTQTTIQLGTRTQVGMGR